MSEPVKEPVQEPVKVPVSEPVKEPVTEPVKEPEDKKYTDKQLNDLIAIKKTEAEKKAIEKVLKELGLTKQEELAELKKLRQESMTEAEKKDAELKAKNEELEAAKAEAIKIKLEAEALRAGIPADKVDRAVKLAALYEGDDKVAQVLKEFPEFAKEGVNVSQKTGDQKKTDEETLMEQARKAAGLI